MTFPSSKDPETAEAEKKGVIDALNSAKGVIKREISKNIKLRHMPELIFKPDTSMEYASHISDILNTLDIPKDEPEEASDELTEDGDEF